MQDSAAIVLLWLSASFDLDHLSRLASDSVRVTHHEIAFVFGPGLKIEDRAGETMGDTVVEVLPPAVNIFATDADKRKSVAPLRFAHWAKLNSYGRVAIGVAFDGPFKSEVEERGMFDVEAAGFDCVLSLEQRREKRETYDQAQDRGFHRGSHWQQDAPAGSSGHG